MKLGRHDSEPSFVTCGFLPPPGTNLRTAIASGEGVLPMVALERSGLENTLRRIRI